MTAVGGLLHFGRGELEECFEHEEKLPEWVARVVDGVDVLVVGKKWRGCKEHPLVEVVACHKKFHFGEGLGVSACDGEVIEEREGLLPGVRVGALARVSDELEVCFCSKNKWRLEARLLRELRVLQGCVEGHDRQV